MAKTLYEKLFDAHVVYEAEGETPILYINRHLIHEVTNPYGEPARRGRNRAVQHAPAHGRRRHGLQGLSRFGDGRRRRSVGR